MKDLAAGERLGRKFTCAPFIPHGRGLIGWLTEKCTLLNVIILIRFMTLGPKILILQNACGASKSKISENDRRKLKPLTPCTAKAST